MKTIAIPTKERLELLLHQAATIVSRLGEHKREFFENDSYEFSDKSTVVKRYGDGLIVVCHRGDIVLEAMGTCTELAPSLRELITYSPGSWERRLSDFYNKATTISHRE